jgi:acyl-CoA reductase-like NAD-dependent aldehyde dehydrogenase
MKSHLFFGSTCKEKKEYQNILNPYNGKVVSQMALCDGNDAKEILQIAKQASKEAKKSLLSQRISWLQDVANKLENEKKRFATIITDEVGKPLQFSLGEVQRTIETVRLSAQAMSHLSGETFNTDVTPSGKKTLAFYKREPVGVVLAITPFNFPLNLIAHKIAPALVAGNAVILKPTSQAPRIAYEFVKLFIESPFCVKDALSLIYSGEGVNETLIKSDIPRVISFTGSVAVGKKITEQAGIKKIALELGGNAATFIDESADINIAANKCTLGAFVNSGQVCISLQRIYVHEKVYETFAKALKEESEKLVVGSPYEKETFIGPMVNKEAVEKAKIWIENAKEEGAKVYFGGTCKDLLFVPTIMVDVTEEMNIVCQEVFAPIVSLIRVKDYEDALEKMNNAEYGLQYSIFSNNLVTCKDAIDELDAGGIVINDIPTLRFDVQPYGGFKQSGIGKEGPLFALKDDYTQIKSIVIC